MVDHGRVQEGVIDHLEELEEVHADLAWLCHLEREGVVELIELKVGVSTARAKS